MGCDIHGPFIEVKEFPGSPHDPWWTNCEFHGDRDYTLFGVLAGVRAIDDPTVPVRGYPDDASSAVRQHQDSDCHSASWLTAEELERVQADYFGETGTESNDIVLWVRVMNHYHAVTGHEVRAVFCFDN